MEQKNSTNNSGGLGLGVDVEMLKKLRDELVSGLRNAGGNEVGVFNVPHRCKVRVPIDFYLPFETLAMSVKQRVVAVGSVGSRLGLEEGKIQELMSFGDTSEGFYDKLAVFDGKGDEAVSVFFFHKLNSLLATITTSLMGGFVSGGRFVDIEIGGEAKALMELLEIGLLLSRDKEAMVPVLERIRKDVEAGNYNYIKDVSEITNKVLNGEADASRLTDIYLAYIISALHYFVETYNKSAYESGAYSKVPLSDYLALFDKRFGLSS